MVKTMEKLVEKLSLDNKPHVIQAKNPNFRRSTVPQIRKREQRIPVDHLIRPPFQNNYVAKFFEEPPEDIHCFDLEEPQIYLTKEEHDMFIQYHNDELKEKEDYRKGYQNAIMEFQKNI
jgi:hypothetical protein